MATFGYDIKWTFDRLGGTVWFGLAYSGSMVGPTFWAALTSWGTAENPYPTAYANSTNADFVEAVALAKRLAATREPAGTRTVVTYKNFRIQVTNKSRNILVTPTKENGLADSLRPDLRGAMRTQAGDDEFYYFVPVVGSEDSMGLAATRVFWESSSGLTEVAYSPGNFRIRTSTASRPQTNFGWTAMGENMLFVNINPTTLGSPDAVAKVAKFGVLYRGVLTIVDTSATFRGTSLTDILNGYIQNTSGGARPFLLPLETPRSKYLNISLTLNKYDKPWRQDYKVLIGIDGSTIEFVEDPNDATKMIGSNCRAEFIGTSFSEDYWASSWTLSPFVVNETTTVFIDARVTTPYDPTGQVEQQSVFDFFAQDGASVEPKLFFSTSGVYGGSLVLTQYGVGVVGLGGVPLGKNRACIALTEYRNSYPYRNKLFLMEHVAAVGTYPSSWNVTEIFAGPGTTDAGIYPLGEGRMIYMAAYINTLSTPYRITAGEYLLIERDNSTSIEPSGAETSGPSVLFSESERINIYYTLVPSAVFFSGDTSDLSATRIERINGGAKTTLALLPSVPYVSISRAVPARLSSKNAAIVCWVKNAQNVEAVSAEVIFSFGDAVYKGGIALERGLSPLGTYRVSDTAIYFLASISSGTETYNFGHVVFFASVVNGVVVIQRVGGQRVGSQANPPFPDAQKIEIRYDAVQNQPDFPAICVLDNSLFFIKDRGAEIGATMYYELTKLGGPYELASANVNLPGTQTRTVERYTDGSIYVWPDTLIRGPAQPRFAQRGDS